MSENVVNSIIETAKRQGFQCAVTRMNETAYLFVFSKGYDDGSHLELRRLIYIGVRGGAGIYRKYYIRRMSLHSLRQKTVNSLTDAQVLHERRHEL